MTPELKAAAERVRKRVHDYCDLAVLAEAYAHEVQERSEEDKECRTLAATVLSQDEVYGVMDSPPSLTTVVRELVEAITRLSSCGRAAGAVTISQEKRRRE